MRSSKCARRVLRLLYKVLRLHMAGGVAASD